MTSESSEPSTRRPQQRSTASGGSVSANIGGSNSGDIVGGDKTTSTSTKNVTKRPGLILLAVVIVVVLIIVLLKTVVPAAERAMHDGGLSASSTCQQFLDTDEATEQQAIVDIADSNGEGGFGSPLALPAIRYDCSAEPNATLGSVIEKFRGQF